MSLDNLNKWLTLIANLGVLIGIVFLVVELEQNTSALKVESIWAATAYSATQNDLLTTNDQMRELVFAALNDPSSLSEQELFQANFMIRSLFNFFLAQFYTYQEAGMSEDRWNGVLANFANFANMPGGRAFLEQNADIYRELSGLVEQGATRRQTGLGFEDVFENTPN